MEASLGHVCAEQEGSVSCWHPPARQDVPEGHPDRELRGIRQGLTDSTVAVDRNETEMQDGAEAEEGVQVGVQAAERVSEEPAALHGADSAEGQHQQTQEHVGQGQGGQQEVGGSVKRSEVGHSEHHKQISQDRDQHACCTGQVDGQPDAQGMDCPGARPVHLVTERLGALFSILVEDHTHLWFLFLFSFWEGLPVPNNNTNNNKIYLIND